MKGLHNSPENLAMPLEHFILTYLASSKWLLHAILGIGRMSQPHLLTECHKRRHDPYLLSLLRLLCLVVSVH